MNTVQNGILSIGWHLVSFTNFYCYVLLKLWKQCWKHINVNNNVKYNDSSISLGMLANLSNSSFVLKMHFEKKLRKQCWKDINLYNNAKYIDNSISLEMLANLSNTRKWFFSRLMLKMHFECIFLIPKIGSYSDCKWPYTKHVMTSLNGNIFRVTGHLCGEFTSPRWIPRTKASDTELGCFLWSASE